MLPLKLQHHQTTQRGTVCFAGCPSVFSPDPSFVRASAPASLYAQTPTAKYSFFFFFFFFFMSARVRGDESSSLF